MLVLQEAEIITDEELIKLQDDLRELARVRTRNSSAVDTPEWKAAKVIRAFMQAMAAREHTNHGRGQSVSLIKCNSEYIGQGAYSHILCSASGESADCRCPCHNHPDRHIKITQGNIELILPRKDNDATSTCPRSQEPIRPSR